MSTAPTKLERFAEVPWGTIISLVNVGAGVVGAIGLGIATVAQQLPAGLPEKYGAAMSLGAGLCAALAGGLYAIGKGLHKIGQGNTDMALAHAGLLIDSEVKDMTTSEADTVTQVR